VVVQLELLLFLVLVPFLYLIVEVQGNVDEGATGSVGRCVVFGEEDHEEGTKVPNECRAFFGSSSSGGFSQYAYFVPKGYNVTSIKVHKRSF